MTTLDSILVGQTTGADFLKTYPFGQLIVGQTMSDLTIFPTHFHLRNDRHIEGHFGRQNALTETLKTATKAWFSVCEAYAFIPAYWNIPPGIATNQAAPTSYYISIQLFGSITRIEDRNALAELLNRQLAQLQPEGGTDIVQDNDTRLGRMLNHIIGWEIHIENVRYHVKLDQHTDKTIRASITQKLKRRHIGRDHDIVRYMEILS